MTKPANFPGRIHARRVRAIERLEAINGRRGRCLSRHPVTDELAASKLSYAARSALADSIALKLNSNARGIRTKKMRGATR